MVNQRFALALIDELADDTFFLIDLVRAVADRVPVPVIASGGGGTPESLADALDDGPGGGHAQAALAASIFHFGETTVGEVKRRLLELGIQVRPPSAS